ncbi:unnamed protein product [Clonostachys rosea f. rosea IK726]|uniref:Uncharacterized protein n=1 Tax=Clonostachys rosea f. rosea IK726 TaxID=1349383 RepID=A0ACA9TVS6_BIOOC|nr:unnamed protein product [Clonostachys rosea f. rosea IK726]
MKPSTSLFVALHHLGLVSAASIAKPDDIVQNLETRYCFNLGEVYGDEEGEALVVARKACESNFHGTWKRGEYRKRCYNLSRHKHLTLLVHLSGKSPDHVKNLTSEECYRRLSDEISDCPQGSHVWHGLWRYKLDPTQKTCPGWD